MSEMNRRKTLGFKPIMVSPENHAWLTKVTNKSQIFNDIITELLKDKTVAKRFDAVGLQGVQVGPQTLVAPESKGELHSHG